MKEFNFIVDNGHIRETDIDIFFSGENVEYINIDVDMYDILVLCDIFKSKSDARKNWKRTGKDIPCGFTDLEKVGKFNTRITILNPMV